MADPKCWAVVPAAGKGTRMGTAQPKQYLELSGKTIIEHSLSRVLSHARIVGAVVAIAPDDAIFNTLAHVSNKPVFRAEGGAERCHSVLNALDALHGQGAAIDDWVLVHDAARPCVRLSDIDKLIDSVIDDDNGGLLGVPVADTLKRCDSGQTVVDTVDRTRLWRALTPQMFKLGLLRESLREVIQRGALVTDDASAMEQCGFRPHMVEGHADNIKVTRPEDLRLAALYLELQRGESCA